MKFTLTGRMGICLVLMASFTGCQDKVAEQTAMSEPSKAQRAASDGTEPVSIGEKYRDVLTRKALHGLDYSTGRITFDQTVAVELTDQLTLRQADAKFATGQAAFEKGELIKALEETKLAIMLDANRAEYYEILGETLFRKKKLDFAEAAFRTALDLEADSTSAMLRLAKLLSNSVNRADEAIASYQKVVELDPENGLAYSRLAVLHFYQNRKDLARQMVGRAELNGEQVAPQFKMLLDGNVPRAAAVLAGNLPTVGAQTRVDVGNNSAGNETTCVASDLFPDVAVAGWNDYREPGVRSGFALTTDGGASWVDSIIRPLPAFQGNVEGDAMTCADDRTGNIWVGAISFDANGGVYVARLNAGETTFQPPVMAAVSGIADKGWMVAGPAPNAPEETRLYIGYNDGGSNVLVSADEGDSWTGPIPLPAGGLGQLPRVGPNGELYITYWNFGFQHQIVRSFDGGLTFEGPFTIANRMDFWSIDGTRFPGAFRVGPLVTSAVDPNDGTLYAVYPDTTSVDGGNSNVDVYFTRSTDQGTTWSTPSILNTDAPTPGDQFFPFIEVDQNGRLHVLFYDTRAVVQNDNVTDGPGMPPAMIEAWYAFSDDQGDSWTELVLTDLPFSSADDGFGDGFIGDYLGIGVAGDTAYPCYMSTHEGIANVFAHAITSGFLLGDINRDGAVDLLDVDGFVNLIIDMEFDKAADFNGDGNVNLLDVAGFVALLSGS